tara:strand:+ start:1299 stop:2249 length:951 start_codon:yes stop_codon:yes gene_type:complete
MSLKCHYSIVIPVYCNERTLKELLVTLKGEVIEKNKHLNAEIIFVDDGSKDDSYNQLKQLKKIHSDINCKIIKLTRNFGQGPAIFAGYENAKGDCVINIAADLQDPVEILNEMLQYYFEQNYKVVLPVRRSRDDSFFRNFASKIFYWIIRKLSFKNMPLGGFDIFLIDNKIAKFILGSKESDPFIQGQILWSGYKPKYIFYDRKKRSNGKSKHTLSKLIKFFIDGVMSYSFFPIRMMSYIGILISIIGFSYGIYIIYDHITYVGPPRPLGWASLMIVILLIGGFQMVMLGIIGEYIWRTLSQSRGRPQYIIEEMIK